MGHSPFFDFLSNLELVRLLHLRDGGFLNLHLGIRLAGDSAHPGAGAEGQVTPSYSILCTALVGGSDPVDLFFGSFNFLFGRSLKPAVATVLPSMRLSQGV